MAIGKSACLVLAVWSVLLLGGMLRPWLGEHAAVALSFASALALVLWTRGRREPVDARARAVPAALAFAAGAVSLPAWIAFLAPVGLALGFTPRAPTGPLGAEPVAWLSFVVLAPLFEELLYRERLIPALAPRLGTGGAIVVSSLVFALPHLEPWALLGTFACGLVLAALFCATGSVTVCIAYHMGLNAAAALGGLPPALLQAVAVCAAFWIALGVTCACERDPALRARAGVGLVLGAVAAHAGWILLHWEHWAAARSLPGASVLFVPFGLLAAAPRRSDPARTRYLHASFLGLPLALAAARVGCVLRGCCAGPRVYEIAGLLALFVLVRAVPPASTAPVVLAGIGLLRLLLEPLRAEGPVHPSFPVEGVALALVATGAAMAWGRTAPGPLRRSA